MNPDLLISLAPYLIAAALALAGVALARGDRPRLWLAGVTALAVTYVTAGIVFDGDGLFDNEVTSMTVVAATIPLQLAVIWWMSTRPVAGASKSAQVLLGLAAVGSAGFVAVASFFLHAIASANWSL